MKVLFILLLAGLLMGCTCHQIAVTQDAAGVWVQKPRPGEETFYVSACRPWGR